MTSILTKILGRTKKPPKRLPIWETYNGQIADMRREGHTLQEIGDAMGVTRERVRQILKEHYGRVEPLLLNEYKVASIIGCPIYRLIKLRETGAVSPIRLGKGSWLYDRGEMEKAMLALQRNCLHCGQPLLIEQAAHSKYCSECAAEYRRYNYPFLSDETKERAKKASIKWQKQHPEQYKEIVRKAMKKYWQKKWREHYANTKYIVVSGEVMPIGSVFKATRCENRYLVLEGGLRISINNVRKVKIGGKKGDV